MFDITFSKVLQDNRYGNPNLVHESCTNLLSSKNLIARNEDGLNLLAKAVKNF